MSKLKARFGKRLRQIRRYQDLTQEQLAEAIGVSVAFLSNIERGLNAPSFETLEKLAQALRTPVHELFIFSDQPNT
jgi:transcriptional regulator with XRE-family HTH domain